jgi:hypothetical protein
MNQMTESTVTLILLNCKREANVRDLVSRYCNMNVVGEVIVWSSPPGNFVSSHPKVKTATCSPDWGMFPRYMVATLAANRAVLALDDDLFLPSDSIEALLAQWKLFPEVVHGISGRHPDKFGKYGTCNLPEVEVIVGRCGLFARRLASVALEALDDPQWDTLWSEAVLLNVRTSQIEDMVLSYAAIAQSRRLNRVSRLPFTELPAPAAICSNPNHYVYRNIGMQFCRRFFGIEKFASLHQSQPQ